jgi:predicted enzyme related to lactoylglutathione lyase
MMPGAVAGQFVWRDLMSTDPVGSAAFYAAVFGWEVVETDLGPLGTHRLFQDASGERVGSILPIPAGKGYPSNWVAYLRITDVARVVKRAKGLGGVVHVGPAEVPGVGRYALIEDPTGAGFGVLQFDADAPEPPAESVAVWHELCTGRVDAALTFYTGLFGLGTQAVDLGNDWPYHLLTPASAGGPAAGVMGMPSDMTTPTWVITFAVADLDAARERVLAQGGHLDGPVMTIPGTGKVCWARDQVDAVLCLREPERPA